jgi:hypothetical protein
VAPVVPVAPVAVEATAPAEPPIEFTGPPQRIDRARLRANGLIVPDGAVTTLIEEFRIVKRQILLGARDALDAGGGPRASGCSSARRCRAKARRSARPTSALSVAVEKDIEVVLVDADFAKPSIVLAARLSGRQGADGRVRRSRVRDEGLRGRDRHSQLLRPARGNRTASDSEYVAAGRHCPTCSTG